MAYVDRQKYDCVTLYIGPDGFPASAEATRAKLREIIDHGAVPLFHPEESIPPDFRQWVLGAVPPRLDLFGRHGLDIVFPVFHGQSGEDAIFQGVLEFLQLPYIGCGLTGSIIGNDKELNKRICRGHGIAVAEFRGIKRDQWLAAPERFTAEIETAFGYPVFVKPPCLGSSLGISKAYDREHFQAAMNQALAYGDKALVERPIAGKEYGVGLIGNETPEVSEIVEFGQCEDFQDYAAKYGPNACVDTIPAALDEALKQRMIALARRIYIMLDLCGMSRIDFFIADGRIVFNEVNTVPGFGKNSVFSKIWAASGVGLTELIDRLVAFGFERARNRQQLKFDLATPVKESRP